MFAVPNFLPGELCDALIALIDANRRPSTIADPNGDDYFRTSETCDLDPGEPAVRDVEARLLALTGIDPAHGEPIQGQRYEVGQEFKAHTDYFEPDGQDFSRYCTVAGQRTWTFMAYLNDVDAGGATRFKLIDKIFQPRRGMLVGWNNRRPDGSLNRRYAAPRHESAERPQVRDHQVVSREAVGMSGDCAAHRRVPLRRRPLHRGAAAGAARRALQLLDLRDERRGHGRRARRSVRG